MEYKCGRCGETIDITDEKSFVIIGGVVGFPKGLRLCSLCYRQEVRVEAIPKKQKPAKVSRFKCFLKRARDLPSMIVSKRS